MFVRFFAFRYCKGMVRTPPKPNFSGSNFSAGGGNSLIINTMKNLILPIFQPIDYQQVTKPISELHGKGINMLIICALRNNCKQNTTFPNNTGINFNTRTKYQVIQYAAYTKYSMYSGLPRYSRHILSY